MATGPIYLLFFIPPGQYDKVKENYGQSIKN